MHYGAPTPKRSRGYSNAASSSQIDKGKLTRAQAKAQTRHKLALSTNRAGKKGWSGVRKALKDSQPCPQMPFAFMIARSVYGKLNQSILHGSGPIPLALATSYGT